jgi:hypothetical protein
MRRLMAAVTFGCCLVIAGQSEGFAQGPDYIKLKALLPPAPGAQACFVRTYDADHLKRHPKQKVTELILSIRYVTLGEDEAVIVATEGGGTEKRYFDYDFTLAAKTKAHDRTLYASGDCASAEGIGCGVECDGGGIEIEPIAGDKDSILMRFSESGYIRMTLGCRDEENSVELKPGEDDKVFKLTKAPAAICDAMEARLGNRL